VPHTFLELVLDSSLKVEGFNQTRFVQRLRVANTPNFESFRHQADRQFIYRYENKKAGKITVIFYSVNSHERKC
jgi:hypothetical protein